MKKNFFKKLSFVMALAMIVSVVAPAAGAFAATSLKLSASNKTLLLGNEDRNDYNFDIVGSKGTGWTYAWTSSNKAVATVNAKNGVVSAVKKGSAKITVVIKNAKGAKVDTLTANVTVKSNIKELGIYAQDPKDADLKALKVATDYDFGRTYKTEAGLATGTTSVTRWLVTEGATISDAGVFNASKPGDYTITAVAFQSTAKYDEWVAAGKDLTSALVLASKTQDVTVVNTVAVKQLTDKTAELTFAAAATKDEITKNLTVNKLVGTTPVKQTVKSVTIDKTDAKKAVVEIYAGFAQEATYTFAYTGAPVVSFVAAKASAAAVVDMVFATTEATINTATDVKVKLLNADGVDLSTIDPNLSSRVTMTSSSPKAYFNIGTMPNEVTMYTVGDSTTITAIYHTYDIDSATGTEKGAITKTGVVSCVAVSTNPVSSLAAWTMVKSGDPVPSNFDTVNHVIAAGDTHNQLYVRALKADGTTYVNNLASIAPANFKFTSSDSSVLVVTPNGDLYPVKAGTANVVVEFTDDTAVANSYKIVDAIPVTVSAKRVGTTLNLDSYNFALSNSGAGLLDSKLVKIEVLDQYGVKMPANDVTLTETTSVTSGTHPITAGAKGKVSSLTFTGNGSAEGSYTYALTTEGLTRYLVVTVNAPKNAQNGAATASTRYGLSVDSNYDAKVSTTVVSTTANIKVVGYAANNVAYESVTSAGLVTKNLVVELTKPDGAVLSVTSAAVFGNLVENTVSYAGTYGISAVSGGAEYVKAATGTYTLKLYSVSGDGVTKLSLLDQATFTVTDTQAAPAVTVKQLETAAGTTTIDGAIGSCFGLPAGYTFEAAQAGDYTNTVAANQDVFVFKVRVRETVNGYTVHHVVDVNQLITIK